MKKTKNKNWRDDLKYKQWRKKIIDRDKRCVICNATDNLVAHHLFSGSKYKRKRYKLDNGVCLCYDCHMNFHTNFKRSYRQSCTKYDFDNFFELSKYFRDKFSKHINKDT